MEPVRKWAERPPDVSFVVPSFRSRETIAATLDSIRAQQTTRSFETMVVDSTGDDTGAWITALHPGVRVISSATRLYPGAARNLGARHSTAEILAFVDADAALAGDWLEQAFKGFSDSRVTLLGGSVANANAESVASRVLHWIEFSEYLPGLPAGFRAAVSSANLLVRKREFLRRGGFNEAYRMAEDLLLCRHWGEGLYFEPAARAFHRHRDKWMAVFRHLGELGFWSGVYRREHGVKGSWLKEWPAGAAGLPAARTALIVGRVFRHDGGEGLMAAALAPALMMALTRWAWGFYKGIRAERAEPADPIEPADRSAASSTR